MKALPCHFRVVVVELMKERPADELAEELSERVAWTNGQHRRKGRLREIGILAFPFANCQWTVTESRAAHYESDRSRVSRMACRFAASSLAPPEVR